MSQAVIDLSPACAVVGGEKNAAAQVPAKRFVPLTARAKTRVFVKPVLTAVQLVPLLVERKTPPPSPCKEIRAAHRKGTKH